MTIETSPPLAPFRDDYLVSVLDWQRAFFNTWIEGQRNQFQVLNAWTNAFKDVNQELWDEWVCRFGGGVPLDG
jgi:hypothetical protein